VRALARVDLGAIERNCARLAAVAAPARLCAVVKADGYGHGALDVARAALAEGAGALCVATVAEALPLRAVFQDPRILVMGPARDLAAAREARLEVAVGDGRIPEGLPVHLKLDTGMGRWGFSELPAPTRDVVGLMTHFASADCDPEFTRTQIERFRAATDALSELERPAANSAGALRFP
jgi:alanine racemase